jgi:hypothetical protein
LATFCNSYTKFHEYLMGGLVTDTKAQADETCTVHT